MKKAISLLLLLAMTLTLLAGCGKTETPAPAPAPQAPVTDVPAETPELPETPAEPVTLVDPGWVEPVYDIEETLEVRQKAITATSVAYYLKGLLNQYGLQDLNIIDEFSGGGLRGKTLDRNSPEENTPDQTLYQWCSSYVYDVIYQTMGYKINDDYRDCRTASLARGQIGDREMLVYQYEHTGDDAKDRPVVDQIIAGLQPGDIVTYTIPDGNGHSLMVVNDITGDGIMDVLHRTGVRYDMSTGEDKTETYGIKREPLSTFQSGTQCLYDKVRLSVIRATNLDAAQYPLTNAAKARLAWPDLRIDRTVEGGIFSSVVSGGELTYTITLYNYGAEAIVGLPVMDRLDSHCTMLTQDGKPATTTYPVWSVDIQPGENVVLTYTVKVEGNPGEKIVSEGGSVAGIPSNVLTTTIQAFQPDAEKLQAEQDAVAAAAKDGLEFVNKLYEAATGVNPGIGEMETVREQLFDAEQRGNYFLYRPKADVENSMLVPEYVGGRHVLTPDNERVLETRLDDLRAGDIIVVDGVKQNKPVTYYWIYNGSKLLEWNNGKVKTVSEKNLVKVLSYPWFVLLRPSLAQ